MSEHEIPRLSEAPPVYGGLVTTLDRPRQWNDEEGWERVALSITRLLRHATGAYHKLGLDPKVHVPEAEIGPTIDRGYRPRPLGWYTQVATCSAVLVVEGVDWACVVLGEHTQHKCGKYEWRT